MNQAQLPIELYETTIADMEPGDKGWTTPWAMWVDMDGFCWLNTQYTISQSPGGTVQILVVRTFQGFEVCISGCEYKWIPKEKPNYVGDSTYEPIRKVVR